MRTNRAGRRSLAAAGIVFAVVASQAGTPSIAHAEEIAWRQVTEQTFWDGRSVERAGNATFKDGAIATVTMRAKVGPISAVDLSGSYEGQVVFTFPDRSTITARYGVTEKSDYTQSGWGEFASGTGRYQGITGKYTIQGKRGDTEQVGTYSLPGK